MANPFRPPRCTRIGPPAYLQLNLSTIRMMAHSARVVTELTQDPAREGPNFQLTPKPTPTYPCLMRSDPPLDAHATWEAWLDETTKAIPTFERELAHDEQELAKKAEGYDQLGAEIEEMRHTIGWKRRLVAVLTEAPFDRAGKPPEPPSKRPQRFAFWRWLTRVFRRADRKHASVRGLNSG